LLLALADANSDAAGRTWRRARRAIDSPGGVAVLLIATVSYIIGGGRAGPGFYQGYRTMVTYLVASILAAGWVIVASGSRPLEWRLTRAFAWLGRRGYGLYAWHWPVLLVLLQVPALTSRAGGLTVSGFVASLAGTVLLAILSYRYLEVPFLRLRLRFQVVQNRL
jgi:peptidoglycan/LPS O-acetylase OafA/YrhL